MLALFHVSAQSKHNCLSSIQTCTWGMGDNQRLMQLYLAHALYPQTTLLATFEEKKNFPLLVATHVNLQTRCRLMYFILRGRQIINLHIVLKTLLPHRHLARPSKSFLTDFLAALLVSRFAFSSYTIIIIIVIIPSTLPSDIRLNAAAADGNITATNFCLFFAGSQHFAPWHVPDD